MSIRRKTIVLNSYLYDSLNTGVKLLLQLIAGMLRGIYFFILCHIDVDVGNTKQIVVQFIIHKGLIRDN